MGDGGGGGEGSVIAVQSFCFPIRYVYKFWRAKYFSPGSAMQLCHILTSTILNVCSLTIAYRYYLLYSASIISLSTGSVTCARRDKDC